MITAQAPPAVLTARTSISKPAEKQYPDERAVFNLLRTLPHDWYVTWGYYYYDRKKKIDREGDFLVLSPKGQLLVIESKDRNHLAVTPEGIWSGPAKDNPLDQVGDQYGSIKDELNTEPDDVDIPKLQIRRALAIPNLNRYQIPEIPQICEGDTLILASSDLGDLKSFYAAWGAIFGTGSCKTSNKRSCQRFHDSKYGKRFEGKAGKTTSRWIDSEIKRFTEQEFTLFDHLPTYQRFTITGLPGTGKTWLLLEIARRWRIRFPEARILILCYNTALASWLKQATGKIPELKKTQEFISVKTLEELATHHLPDSAPKPPPIVSSRQEKSTYYTDTLPKEAAKVSPVPQFDALIVDEAQDINTHGDAVETLGDSGWWSFFLSLVRKPATAPIAVAYDTLQRPSIRSKDGFQEETLREWLGESALRLHCPLPLRYTQEIASYLREVARASHLLKPLCAHITDQALESLPCSRTVELYTSASPDATKAKADEIAKRWMDEGLVHAHEILLITPSSKLSFYGFGDKLAEKRLTHVEQRQANNIGHVSALAGKGLDSKAVIVAGFKTIGQLKEKWPMNFFMAVSRARQYLAVISFESAKNA